MQKLHSKEQTQGADKNESYYFRQWHRTDQAQRKVNSDDQINAKYNLAYL